MKVSIIMPVFNAENTLLKALKSLQNQTYKDTEIIVVNDGSMDGSLQILEQQNGIILINRPHRGIVPALNDAISISNGELIARMDADDTCEPERIQEQVKYIKSHPRVDFVSCLVGYGGNRTTQKGYATYVDWMNTLTRSDELALNRFIESPFSHPSMLFRRNLIDRFGAYKDGMFPEDYELWLRWMNHGIQAGKVNKRLFTWNDPPKRLSRIDSRYSTEAFFQMKADYLSQWLKSNNPHHPDILIWGAGRLTRKRVDMLRSFGIKIAAYIDIKQRKLNCGTPVLLPTQLPRPNKTFILSMVSNRGARNLIRNALQKKGFIEGRSFLFGA